MNGWLYPGKLQNIKKKEFEIIHSETLRAITQTTRILKRVFHTKAVYIGGRGETMTNHQNPFQNLFQVKQRNSHYAKVLS